MLIIIRRTPILCVVHSISPQVGSHSYLSIANSNIKIFRYVTVIDD